MLSTPEKMLMLYIIVSVSLSTISLALQMCPESIPTVSIVNRCPSNATEWVSAAKRKSCNDLGQLQRCTTADDFVYHCVLNKDATLLLEVCAPTHLMSGYCARFSEVQKRIIIDTGLDCTKFDPPCSASFLSNESYRYQTCYRNAGEYLNGFDVSQEKKVHVTIAIVIPVILATIILLILIFIGVGYKLEKITFGRRKQTLTSEIELSEDDETVARDLLLDISKPSQQGVVESNDEREEAIVSSNGEIYNPTQGPSNENNVQVDKKSSKDKKAMRFESLSGEKKGNMSLKDVKTISDVRDKLAEKLNVLRDTLYVVNKEHWMLWSDDTEITDLPADTLSLMVVLDENRMKQSHDGGSKGDADEEEEEEEDEEEEDTEGEESLLGFNRCKHLKGSWFNWTKKQLLDDRNCSVNCEVCGLNLDFDKIVEKCKMTQDEQIFFQQVLSFNSLDRNLADQLAVAGNG